MNLTRCSLHIMYVGGNGILENAEDLHVHLSFQFQDAINGSDDLSKITNVD